MSNGTHGPEYRYGDFARALFVSLMQFDRLTDNIRSQSGGVSFGRLYAYATDPHAVMDEAMRAALDQDAALARSFDRLMTKTAAWCLPQAVAASTGLTTRREGSGCVISFRESMADPRQVYVIIEVEAMPANRPRSLFVRTADNAYEKFPLPEPDGETIQLLMESDSELVRKLRDVETEIFLR